MKMKYKLNALKVLLNKANWIFLLCISALFYACEDDELGAPEIYGLRLTDPEKADSLFNGGSLGQNIVIMGNNLGSTKQVLFNNIEAYVNPNYVRNDNIILNVPTEVPSELTNEITVITDGGVATYPFDVEVPEPVVDNVSLEVLSGGETITIDGDFFFSSEVTIGGVAAEVITETQDQLVITVGEGTTGGELKIKTLFGEASYKYEINDMGTLLLDFEDDGVRDCWAKLNIISAATDPKPVPLITGNYGHAETENMGQTGWFDPGVITTCGSAGVSGTAENKAVKFEINVPTEIEAGYYQITIASTWNYTLSLWNDAPFKTDGWRTITIPLSDFVTGDGVPISSAESVADFLFVFKIDGADESNPVFNWNIDNLRIVSAQ